MKPRHTKKIFFVVGMFFLFVGILFLSLFSRKVGLNLNNGGVLSVESPSFLSSLRGTEAKIFYQPDKGQVGMIYLWRSFVDQPVLLMPIGKTKSLFCVYNYDTDFRLICINPDSKFTSFPSNNWSCLKGIVCSTPWTVKEANLAEWEQALKQINEMSPTEFKHCRVPIYDFLLVRFGFSFGDVSHTLEEQIHLMQNAGSDQWPIIESHR